MGSARPSAVVAALVLALVAAIAFPSLRPSGLLRDFEAFYCAGSVLNAHADPYRAEPLGACERTPKPPPLLTGEPGLAAPAPLPPFALLPFRALALLPYPVAGALWTLLGIVAVAVAALATARLTGLPLAATLAAFALTDGYASLALGQVAPFAIAALALAALFADEERDVAAGFAAGCAMIEPHVGLFACAALFIFRPKARLPLVALVLAGIALSLAAAGSAIGLEYVREVLPAHALSEIANEKQFSLTYLLHRLGVADGAALTMGNLSYAVAAIAGVGAARALQPRLGAAALVAVPTAFAVTGGPFVHISQIAAAIPAALLLVARGSAGARRVAGIALVVLAIPWIQFANLGTIFIALAALAAGYLTACFIADKPAFVALAATTAVVVLAIAIALVRPVPSVAAIMLSHYDPRALAEDSWRLYVASIGIVNATAFDVAKIPTALALIALAVATLLDALGRGVTSGPSVARGGNGGEIPRRTVQR